MTSKSAPDIVASTKASWVRAASFLRGYNDAAGLDKARSVLLRWIEEAREYGLPELKAFVAKLFQDMDAVVAAMVRTYSQGQTEGKVNKLKLIKRSMYGWGKFDLIRQRVLYASAA